MTPALVGRADELGTLGSALAEPGCAVVLHGEPGVGKTALANAAVSGHGLLVGGALPSLSWMRHLPLVRALGDHLDETAWRGDAEDVAARVETAVAGDVLFLDDLHWADPATLGVVELLVGRVRLLTAVRRGDPAAPATLTRLTEAGCSVLEVEPLADRVTAELARRLQPTIAGPRLDSVVARSGGNPLLVEELVRADGAPDTLRLAIGVRLRVLGESTLRGLTMLSLAGRALPGHRVPGLDELVYAGLVVVDDDQAAVRHALIGEVVVELADDAQRQECHRLLAELLDHPGDRARHLLAAGDPESARAAAMVAIERARTPGERAAHLATAAACVTGTEADELVLAAARAANDAEEPALALDLLQSMSAPAGTHVPAVVERGRALFELGDTEGWRASVLAGLAIAREPVDQLYFRNEEASVAYFVDGDPTRAAALAAAVVADASRQNLPHAAALRMLGTAQYLDGIPAWADTLESALRQAQLEEDTAGAFRAGNNLISAHESAGDPLRAVVMAEEMAATARRLGFGRWERHFLARRLSLAMHAGDHLRVEALAAQLLGQPLAPRTREEVVSALANTYIDTGRVADALALCDELGTAVIRPSERHAVQALAFLADGRPLAALKEREPFLAAHPVSSMVSLLAPVFALAAFDAGRPAPEDDPDLPGWGMLAGVRPELKALADLRSGDPVTAARGFAEAAALWAPYHRRGELRCRWGYGESLRLAGQDAESVAVLLEIEALAEKERLVPLLGRVRRSLRSLGQRRRAGRTSGGSLLTERERQVVTLVGEGLTDATIARRLGLSPRTVQSQLASARRKLGAANRRQAAELLTQQEQP